MEKQRRFLTVTIFSLVAFVVLFSCVTTSGFFNGVDSCVSQADYHTALAGLEENEEILYSNKDLVLKALDKGLLAHYCGDYERSNEELSKAEQYMFEYFSKSISQSIQSFLINDTVIDYPGDPYEDIYVNLFKALNYIALDKIDEAFVEIRRFDTKQKNLSAQYSEAQSRAKQDLDSGSYFGKMTFHNSALARYVSMLMYRTEGNLDSAEVDMKYIKNAFRDQTQLYPFSLPSSLDDELLILPGMARLNILSFTGLAPKKEENLIYFHAGDVFFKLALPVMEKRVSKIVAVKVTATGEATGNTVSFSLEPIEVIDSIAHDTFKEKQDLLYFKAIARSIAKSLTTTVLNVAGRVDEGRNNKDDNGYGNFFKLLGFASLIANDLTEVADLRTSRYFPARASVGGVHLPPGMYTIQIEYFDAYGSVIWKEQRHGYELQEKGINLVEGICLQ